MTRPRRQLARTSVPAGYLDSLDPMRRAQRNFIETLTEQRDVPPDFAHQSLLNKFKEDKITKAEASNLIDALKALPRVYRGGRAAGRTADLPDVPPGRYAIIDGQGKSPNFYRVRRGEGQFDGWTYLDIQASEDYYPITNIDKARRILKNINTDPRTAAVRYSQLLGKCFSCGRTLTNSVSREVGCGEICAVKTGWFDEYTIARLRAAGQQET